MGNNKQTYMDSIEVKTESVELNEEKSTVTEPIEMVKENKTGVVINCDSLNVREYPNGDVINVVSAGTILEIVDEQECWLSIITPDHTIGYVMKNYVEV